MFIELLKYKLSQQKEQGINEKWNSKLDLEIIGNIEYSYSEREWYSENNL